MRTVYIMKCDIDKIITGTIEKKYYLIKHLKNELEKMGINAQIYLVISEKERYEYFKTPNLGVVNKNYLGTINLMSLGSFGSFVPFGSFNSSNKSNLLSNTRYNGKETTIPYNRFKNFFDSLFNKNAKIQNEKNEEFEKLKKYGGYNEKENQEPAEENQEPVEENQEPVEENQEPVEENQEPAEENQEPSEENQEPVEENQEPAEENQEPAEENQEPSEENQEPVEENQEPVEENQEPVEENQEPVEENKEPTQEVEDIEIERFLYYTFNNDLKIRIEVK